MVFAFGRKWLQKWMGGPGRAKARRRPWRPTLEALEKRETPAAFVFAVTDSDATSWTLALVGGDVRVTARDSNGDVVTGYPFDVPNLPNNSIAIQGEVGFADTLTVDFSGGFFDIASISFNAGGRDDDAVDILNIIGTGTTAANTSAVYQPDQPTDVISSNGTIGVSQGGVTIPITYKVIDSPITISEMFSFTFLTPSNTTDNLTVASLGNGMMVSGTSTSAAPFSGITSVFFTNVANFTLDTSNNDGGSFGNDTIILNGPWSGAALTDVSILTGAGNDRLIISNNDLSTPGGGTFTYDGGDGIDSVSIQSPAPDTDFAIADASIAATVGGTLDLNSIESASITGGSGDNDFTVTGWSGTLFLDGSSGNDSFTVDSLNGPTTLLGGGGNDTFTITDIPSDDVSIDGGAGNDTFIITNLTGQATIKGGAGVDGFAIDNISGAASLSGDGDNDTFVLGPISGPATIDGGGGNDSISAGEVGGAASLIGGTGNDTFTLGSLNGPATVDLGDGNDTFAIMAGGSISAEASLIGGGGNDVFVLRAVTAGVTVDGGSGNDSITADFVDGPASLTGGDGNDTFIITNLSGGATVDGGNGVDSLSVSGTISGPAFLTGGAGNDLFAIGSITGPATIEGGTGNDFITVTNLAGSAVIDGEDGSDTIAVLSLSGQATLQGGDGNDNIQALNLAGLAVLEGGDGDDFLGATSLGGRATLRGGAGDDTYGIALEGPGSLSAFTIEDSSGSLDQLSVVASDFSQIMSLRRVQGVNRLVVGKEIVTYDDGLDRATLFAGAGNDRLTVSQRNGNPLPAIAFEFDGETGTDTLIVEGRPVTNVFNLLANRVRVNGSIINFISTERMTLVGGSGRDVFNSLVVALDTNLAHVRFVGLAGNDVFNLTPTTTTRFFVDGGQPVKPAFPGDRLNLVLKGAAGARVVLFPGGSSGFVTFTNRRRIDFISIESGLTGITKVQLV